MIIQYYIDWASIDRWAAQLDGSVIGSYLERLAGIVRRNGCLVKTQYVYESLKRMRSQIQNPQLQGVLSDFDNLYSSGETCHVLDLAAAEFSPARDDRSTLRIWKEYLSSAGFNLRIDDPRCIKVCDNSRSARGGFYIQKTLVDLFREKRLLHDQWFRVQNFGDGVARSDFLNYVRAFIALAKGFIRIYDPYLLSALLPLEESGRIKSWRNSLAFWYDLVRNNRGVRRIEFITCLTGDCREHLNPRDPSVPARRLRISELLSDVFLRTFGQRSGDLEISLHIVSRPRYSDNYAGSFHDRFLSNGRGCFAIGHGIDVLKPGKVRTSWRSGEYLGTDFEQNWNSWEDKSETGSRGEADEAWRLVRKIPPQEETALSNFNVFFGSMEDKSNFIFRPWSPTCVDNMHPPGCEMVSYDEAKIRREFDFSPQEPVAPYIQQKAEVGAKFVLCINECRDDDRSPAGGGDDDF